MTFLFKCAASLTSEQCYPRRWMLQQGGGARPGRASRASFEVGNDLTSWMVTCEGGMSKRSLPRSHDPKAHAQSLLAQEA